MTPIKDLLNKLRWDKTEEQRDYTIGYEDRFLQHTPEIPFTAIKKIDGNFMVLEKNNEEAPIPLHITADISNYLNRLCLPNIVTADYV